MIYGLNHIREEFKRHNITPEDAISFIERWERKIDTYSSIFNKQEELSLIYEDIINFHCLYQHGKIEEIKKKHCE